jgi:hypothetical protein
MSVRRSKQRKLTPQEEAARRLRDARERMSREHYGLQEDQLFAAHGLLSDDVDFMRTMARDDGIAVRETGAGVGKLASLGFIEVRRSTDTTPSPSSPRQRCGPWCYGWRGGETPLSRVSH